MKIAMVQKRGVVHWVLDYGVRGGRRRRQFFRTESAARKALKAAERDVDEIGRAWGALPARQRNGIVEVVQEVASAGLTLREVWDAYRSMRLSPRCTVTLGEALEETIQAKTAANRRPRYVAELDRYLMAFIKGRESRPVSSIASADIESWFAARGEKPGTRASNLGRISALFDTAYRRGWIEENPCDRVERVSVDRTPPRILTPDEAAIALGWTLKEHPRWLAWLVLAMMVGVRPEECDRLTWDDVSFEAGTVTIDAAASKVRQRRIVELHPAALYWLSTARQVGADLGAPHVSRRRFIRALRGKLELARWPQDILRHTAASYLLAEHQDAGRVARMLGNSPGILLRHYQELVTKQQAKAFWSIAPQ